MTPVERLLTTVSVPSPESRERLEQWFSKETGSLAAAFPKIAVDFTEFAAHLGQKLASSPEAIEAPETLRIADLFVAFACSKGDVEALALFDREHLGKIQVLSRGTDPAELEQAVRVRLLVGGADTPPRIAQYSGRGPLTAWVRMTATRTAVDLARAKKSDARTPDDLASTTVPIDPELDYLKARYAVHFRSALEKSLAALSAKERVLLKLCYLENAPPSTIGRMYGVSARTAQRWLVDARTTVLDRTRNVLSIELELDASELDGLMGLVRSQLHMTLERVLGPADQHRSPRDD